MSGIVLDATGKPIAGEARQDVAIRPTTTIVENPYTAPLASFMGMLADPKISAEDMNARMSVMERMMALEKTFEDRQIEREKRDAERAYHQALAQAKAKIPPIKRTKNVKFKSRDPNKPETNYWHEEFGEIVRVCVPILAEFGLHFDFLVEQGIPNQPISVQCVIHHSLGHSVSGKPAYGPRDDSGNKNIIQQSESTVTYLKRSTVKAALGLAAGEVDDDGHNAVVEQPAEPKVTAEQVQTIMNTLAALPNYHATKDTNKLLSEFRIEALEDLPATRFVDVMRRIAEAEVTRNEWAAKQKAQAEDITALKSQATTAVQQGKPMI